MSKKKLPELEKRQYAFEVRAKEDENGGHYIEGRPIVYNRKTDMYYFDEIIKDGALDGADLSDVRFLVNHDTNKIPLARSRKNSKTNTMDFDVDEKGMNINVNLDTENNVDARALYSAVSRGDISGMSFMFGIEDEEWDYSNKDHPTRTINKISGVVEVSAVTFPAYKDTEIYARSADLKKLVETNKAKLENRANGEQHKPVETEEEFELEKLKAESLLNL